MAAIARRSTIRITALLAILVVLVAGLVFHTTHESPSGPSLAPLLTPAQQSAAQAALDGVNPPATFSRYTTWRLSTSSKLAVPCLKRPAVCFGSDAVVRPLAQRSVAPLLARFDVRVTSASCSDAAQLTLGMCTGSATIPGYVLGFIVTVDRPVRPDQHQGTQVVLFAVKVA
jgi:hypothetical protein